MAAGLVTKTVFLEPPGERGAIDPEQLCRSDEVAAAVPKGPLDVFPFDVFQGTKPI